MAQMLRELRPEYPAHLAHLGRSQPQNAPGAQDAQVRRDGPRLRTWGLAQRAVPWLTR